MDIKEEETNETFNETFNNHSLDLHANGERLSVSPNHSRNGLHEPESPAVTGLDASSVSGAFMTPNGADMSGFQPSFNMNNISATLEALNALRSGQFPSAAAAAAAAIQQHQAQAQAQAAALRDQQQQQQQQQLNNNNNNNNNEDDDELHKPLAKRQRTSSGSLNNEEQQTPLPLATSISQCPADNQSASGAANVTVAAAVNGSNPSASAAASVGANSFELRLFMEMQSKEHMLRMKILEVQLQAAKHSRDLVEINKTLALQKLQELASKRLPS